MKVEKGGLEALAVLRRAKHAVQGYVRTPGLQRAKQSGIWSFKK